MPKRKQKPAKKALPQNRSFLLLVWLLAALSIGVLGYWVYVNFSNARTAERLNRIETIYSRLELPNSYQVDRVNVFGDKREYEWDDGRTYSSAINYINADTVNATVDDLDKRVKAIGFEFIDEPYPGTEVSKQYHYKSGKGEYIRVTVSSKVYDDAVRNALIMNKNIPVSVFDGIDKNGGPANVVIKVNLDDNNE